MPNTMALTLQRELLSRAAVAVRTPVVSFESRTLTESQRLRLRAADAWAQLPSDIREGWEHWAAKFRRYSPSKGRVICPTARRLYIQTALNRWRLDPDLPTPLGAPETAFSGDDIGVFVIPGTRREPGLTGHIRFASSGPNRPDVITALLIQKLPRPEKNLSTRSLRAADFVVFSEGQTSIDLPVKPGHYATAYRFVGRETLQMGPILEAGRVSVGIKRRKARATKSEPIVAPPASIAVNLARFARLDVM